jgi:hypothetical protein
VLAPNSWDVTAHSFHHGLQLLNSSKSPFSYRQGFAYLSNTGPNACDFAANSFSYGFLGGDDKVNVSVGYTYVGVVPAHKTLAVRMNYRRT